MYFLFSFTFFLFLFSFLFFFFFFFFFQAEDGIRDADVTGVQTCALPISLRSCGPRPLGTSCHSPTPLTASWGRNPLRQRRYLPPAFGRGTNPTLQIGRASCRERV